MPPNSQSFKAQSAARIKIGMAPRGIHDSLKVQMDVKYGLAHNHSSQSYGHEIVTYFECSYELSYMPWATDERQVVKINSMTGIMLEK